MTRVSILPFRPTLAPWVAVWLSTLATAQARPFLGPESLGRAMLGQVEAALAPLREGNAIAARRQVERLLETAGDDLGTFGYLRALQLSLIGEPEQALGAIDLHFARHPRLPEPEHAPWVGQIYVAALREHISGDHFDARRIVRLASRAADLQLSHAAIAAALRARTPAPTSHAPAAPVRLVLHSLDGRTIELGDHRGRVVLLHFWASWCPLSAAEAPMLRDAYARFHTQGLDLIGVAAEDDSRAAAVRAAATSQGFEWDQVVDGEALTGPLADRFGAESLPFAVLIDRRGIVRRWGDALRGDGLAPAIEAALTEAADVNAERKGSTPGRPAVSR